MNEFVKKKRETDYQIISGGLVTSDVGPVTARGPPFAWRWYTGMCNAKRTEVRIHCILLHRNAD